MSWLPDGVRRRFRLPPAPGRAAAEVDEELSYHFERTVAELEAQGHAPAAARAEAARRFGDVRAWRARLVAEDVERTRALHRRDRLAAVRGELRQLVRGLVAAPGFTLGVVLTLALGIGANATMVGVVDRLLLRAPEGTVSAHELRRVWRQSVERGEPRTDQFFSYPAFADLRDGVEGFTRLGGYSLRDAVTGEGADARPLDVAVVTDGYFATLGTRPALGRFFTDAEARPGAPGDVVVLSHELWRTRFGARPEVIGEAMPIGGHPTTIVGVAPPGMGALNLSRVDVWLPITAVRKLGAPPNWQERRTMTWLRLVGRVRPGTSAAALDAQLTQVLHADHRARDRDEAELAALRLRGLAAGVQPEAGPDPSATSEVATWLAGMSAVLLLIACANVANLLLVRGMRRQRETAVRVALGVSPRRLAGQAFAEAALLAALGGGVALLVAKWSGAAVRTILLPGLAWPDRILDARVAVVTSVAIVATVLLAGLAPALRAARVDVLPALQSGARAGGGRASRLRAVLLATQAALCVLLLVGAGLFVQSLQRARGTELGFDADRLVLVSLPLHRTSVPPAEWPAITRRAQAELARVPGVASVALTNSIPQWSTTTYGISVPEIDSVLTEPALYHEVSPEYLTTAGVALRRGRPLAAAQPDALLVSESTARRLWPAADPIGRCIRLDEDRSAPCRPVVGLVADQRWHGVREESRMQVYALAPDTSLQATELLVRTAAPLDGELDASFEARLRAAALAAEPRADWPLVRGFPAIIEPDYRAWQLGATLFTAFGAMALLLAAVGLYSVIGYAVAQRRHEMGVRRALGAPRGRIARLVVREGLLVTGAGVLVGVALALALASRLESLLFDVPARDPLVLGLTTLAVLLVAALACLAPALRAASVSPLEAMRED